MNCLRESGRVTELHSVELIPGDRGIFDVLVDGNLVYSKYETGQFPEPLEIFQLVFAK